MMMPRSMDRELLLLHWHARDVVVCDTAAAVVKSWKNVKMFSALAVEKENVEVRWEWPRMLMAAVMRGVGVAAASPSPCDAETWRRLAARLVWYIGYIFGGTAVIFRSRAELHPRALSVVVLYRSFCCSPPSASALAGRLLRAKQQQHTRSARPRDDACVTRARDSSMDMMDMEVR